MDTDVHMLLEGTIDELIVKIEPRYQKYIKLGNQCYMLILNGTLQVSELFRSPLSDTLIEGGLRSNEYNRCVANKMIKVSNIKKTPKVNMLSETLSTQRTSQMSCKSVIY